MLKKKPEHLARIVRHIAKPAMIAVAVAIIGVAGLVAPAGAAGEAPEIDAQTWSFSGFFGHYDRKQLRRGHIVYTEVCAACHGLRLLSYRNLMEPGGPQYSEDEVKALIADVLVADEEAAGGERPARPSDRFVSPFANEREAREANNGALPPDLSVIANARSIHRAFPVWVLDLFTGYQEAGADYTHALLTGYLDTPAGFEVEEGLYFNRAFSGYKIAMAPPLTGDGQVSYPAQLRDVHTQENADQYSRDVAAFLMWAAEPAMEYRKRTGFIVMIFLSLFAVLLFLVKRKIWHGAAH